MFVTFASSLSLLGSAHTTFRPNRTYSARVAIAPIDHTSILSSHTTGERGKEECVHDYLTMALLRIAKHNVSTRSSGQLLIVPYACTSAGERQHMNMRTRHNEERKGFGTCYQETEKKDRDTQADAGDTASE
jgi:hypothetical protein